MGAYMSTSDSHTQNVAHLASAAIRTATERNVLATSVLGHVTLSQTILWADAVRRSAHATQQPHSWLVNAAVNAATAAYESLPDKDKFDLAREWAERLAENTPEIVHPGEWREYLDTIHRHACTSVASEADRNRWAMELAAGLIEDRVDTSAISREVGRVSSQLSGDPVELSKEYLRPNRKSFITIVPIIGAREMVGLDRLSDVGDIRVLPEAGRNHNYTRWGAAGGTASEFIKSVSQQSFVFRSAELLHAPRLFLEIETEATDLHAAAEKALSRTQLILDNFHAAHPTIELSVYGVVGTSPIRGNKNVFDIKCVKRSSTERLTLLGVHSSAALAPTKRINSLARSSSPTVTRAAFSWVAIEAAGINKNYIDACARLLTLLEARQLFFTSYRNTVSFANASSDGENRARTRQRVLNRRARKLENHSSRAKNPDSLRMRAARLSVASTLEGRVANMERDFAKRGRDLLESLGVGKTAAPYGDPSFATLGNFDRWARTVRLWAEKAGHPEAAALTELSGRMAPADRMQLLHLSFLVSTPERATAWLESQRSHFHAQLCALYAARNLHLHNGAHDLPGETLLAHSGQAMTDALIEVWTFWSNADGTRTPLEVVDSLSRRYDSLADALHQGRYLEDCSMKDVMSSSWSIQT